MMQARFPYFRGDRSSEQHSRALEAIPRSFLEAWLQLTGICAFAIAQPLLDVIARNGPFLVAHDLNGFEVVLLAVASAVCVPTALAIFELLVALSSVRFAQVTHVTIVGIFGALAIASFVPDTLPLGILVLLILFTVAAVGIAFTFHRSRFFREFLYWSSGAAIIFVLMFLFQSPIAGILRSTPNSEVVETPAEPRQSVFVVVLDALSLASLLDEDGMVNRSWFPNIAWFADRGTWYRNTTTVHDGTNIAVPALLSGRIPREEALPIESEYPGNLFSLLAPTYKLSVQEFVTRLCNLPSCTETRQGTNFGQLLSDLRLLYLHRMLPLEPSSQLLPPLGARWAGFGTIETNDIDGEGLREHVENEFTTAQPPRVGRFIADMEKNESPTLHYLHLGLPHSPWQFVEDGTRYEEPRLDGLSPEGLWTSRSGVVDFGKQRYLQQLAYVDELWGRIIRKIENVGLFEESLIVLLSDHGVAFSPGGPKRDINADTAAEILRVPFIVKYPGQNKGNVDDSRVQTIDLLPTIADVTEADVRWALDGRSLLSPHEKDREQFFYDDGTISRVPDDLSLSRTVSTIADMFDTASRDGLYTYGVSAKLIGRPVRTLPIADHSAPPQATLTNADEIRLAQPGSDTLPVAIEGRVQTPARLGTRVLFGLNEIVAGVGKIVTNTGYFAGFIKPEAFRPPPNDVDIYLYDEGQSLIKADIVQFDGD